MVSFDCSAHSSFQHTKRIFDTFSKRKRGTNISAAMGDVIAKRPSGDPVLLNAAQYSIYI
jgi:hypothetical protein